MQDVKGEKRKKKSGSQNRQEANQKKMKEAAATSKKIDELFSGRSKTENQKMVHPTSSSIPSHSQKKTTELHNVSTTQPETNVGLKENEDDILKICGNASPIISDVNIELSIGDDPVPTTSRITSTSEQRNNETKTDTNMAQQKKDESIVESPNTNATVIQNKLNVSREESDNFSFVDLDADFYFQTPQTNDLHQFLSFHPIQPEDNSLPFDLRKAYVIKNEGIPRQWVSYNCNAKKLFCFVCLAYSTGTSIFCEGFNEWSHVHQRLQEHEESNSHQTAVKAFIREKWSKSLEKMLFTDQLNMRKREVMERRHVFEQIIRTIKLIAKQGLAFRGGRSAEAAYTLADPSKNHGNFLELVLFLAESDPVLKAHINEAIESSKKKKEIAEIKKIKNVGRGGLVTFLSATTVMSIIKEIASEVRKLISSEIRTAKNYSVTMDSTMDINSNDQCVIVLRYVHLENGIYEVKERVFALKIVEKSSGLGLFNLLKNTLAENQISLEKCVADSFDGAANMSGQYNGVTSHLREILPNHIHTWCYAHVLNLVMTDTVQHLTSITTFFNLLRDTHTFFKASYKRLAVYKNSKSSTDGESTKEPLGLTAIGATRWRSKNDALTKIFGNFRIWASDPDQNQEMKKLKDKTVFCEVVKSLKRISEDAEFNSKIRSEAYGLLKQFCSFKTILISMLFSKIFQLTTPASDYLQTRNLDFVQAWRKISDLSSKLKPFRNEFSSVVSASNAFVQYVTLKLQNDNVELIIETKLPERRVKITKKMPGELAEDETRKLAEDPLKFFQCDTFNSIIDTINRSLETRFLSHKELYGDLACFDPKRFKTIYSSSNPDSSIPENALLAFCQCSGLDEYKLRNELIAFAVLWPKIGPPTMDDMYDEEDDEKYDNLESDLNVEFDSDDLNLMDCFLDSEKGCSIKKKCNNCFLCILNFLKEYNMYSKEFTELFKAYKFLLTIPITQVTCERCFSKLKILYHKLRNRLTQDSLEDLFIMNCERELTDSVSNEVIINNLCNKSAEFKKLLIA